MSNDRDARRAAWSTYWAGGRLHSCTGSYAGNYDGAIGDFWRQRFAALRDGDRVLDLATGNGALPRLLWEQRGNRMLQVDAVDLARVAPDWHMPAEQPQVRFHSGIDMENLPFADGCFDLVTSQYGFEYARREPALAELLRVGAADGRIALVLHHAGSVLVRVGRDELANLRLLAAPGGLLDAAVAVIPWLAQARSGRDLAMVATANRDREAYNTAMRALADAIAATAAPDLLLQARDQVQQLLATTGRDAAPTLQALASWRGTLEQGGLRTAEMIDRALDGEAAAALVAAIAAARPEHAVHCEPLQQREGVLGWALSAEPV